jgi:hypothetical protein
MIVDRYLVAEICQVSSLGMVHYARRIISRDLSSCGVIEPAAARRSRRRNARRLFSLFCRTASCAGPDRPARGNKRTH